MNYNQGYLGIYIGSMRSGKSSMGIRQYIHYNGLGRFKCVVVIPDWTIRSDDPMYLAWNIPYVTISQTSSADDQVELIKDYDVIVLDECQFNSELEEVVIRLLNMGKRVYLCGLDGDFKGNIMGDTLNLVPFCNEIIKLKGDCVECVATGRSIINPSIRTIRVDGDNSAPTIQIAGSEVFKPVCLEHGGSLPIPTIEDKINRLVDQLSRLLSKNPSHRERVLDQLKQLDESQ